MTHLAIAGCAYLLLLALVIMFNHGAHKRWAFFNHKAIRDRMAFFHAPKRGRKEETSWTRTPS